MQIVSSKEAVGIIKNGQRIFIHGAAMTPEPLVLSLSERSHELNDIEIIHLHTEGKALYTQDKYNRAFRINSFFVASNLRQAVNEGNANYIPVFLSEIHLLFKNKILNPDVSLLQVSPPDAHGFCSLSCSVDIALAAYETSSIRIAEVNQQAPRTHGSGNIHISRFDYIVESNRPLFESISPEPTETEQKIGYHVATLIDDGATLQMGIGGVPNALLSQLTHHKRLGVHTEMFSDGLISLIEKGVVTGENKVSSKGKVVACFAMGSQKLYRFVDDNPIISMREASFTNDTGIIRMNPKVTAINSAIEIDLTGQVCADSIGSFQYSGVGGQMDFMRGASLSQGGKPIIAMPSTTSSGESKIVSFLKIGAGVTTTRAHIHYVVTEYGIANLFGKNLRQRAQELINIAHPSHRDKLQEEAMLRFRHL